MENRKRINEKFLKKFEIDIKLLYEKGKIRAPIHLSVIMKNNNQDF